MLQRGLPSSALVAAALAVAACSEAKAALSLYYFQQGIHVADNGPGDDDPAIGSISNTESFYGPGSVVVTAHSNSPGDTSRGVLDVHTHVINSSSQVYGLWVAVNDTDFTVGASPMLLTDHVSATMSGGAIGDGFNTQSYADPLNGTYEGPFPTPFRGFSRTGLPTDSFGSDVSTFWTRGAGPYSLTNVMITTFSGGAELDISGTTSTPEPGAISLACLALWTALLGRRRG